MDWFRDWLLDRFRDRLLLYWFRDRLLGWFRDWLLDLVWLVGHQRNGFGPLHIFTGLVIDQRTEDNGNIGAVDGGEKYR